MGQEEGKINRGPDKKIIIGLLEETINAAYTNDILQRLYSTFFMLFLSENKREFERAGVAPFIKKPKKAQVAKLLAAIYASESLFSKMLSMLPQDVVQTFHLLTWEGMCKVSRLEKELNTGILNFGKEKPYYFESMKYVLIPYLFFCFQVKSSYYGISPEQCNIFLPDPIRKVLKTHLKPPSGYDLIPLDTLDKTDFIYENKGGILKELPLYSTYIQQGHLKVSKPGKPLKTSLTELKQYAVTQEFYEGGAKDLAFLKTSLIVALILADKNLAARNIEERKNPLDLLKQSTDNYRQAGGLWNLNNLLLHLKGAHNVSFSENQKVNDLILYLMRELPIGQWISIENLVKFVLLRDINLAIVNKFSAAHYIYFSKYESRREGYEYEEKIYMSEENYNDGLLIPLLKGVMFLFAALGLVDIAYDYPVNKVFQNKGQEYLSVFDGAKYVRLTELGAYITGLTRHYTLPVGEDESAKIILDENRLIITVHGEDRLKRMILQKFADKIAENRYKMDYSSFLRECTSKKDIQQKIKLFKTEISSKLPEVWVDFFDRALARVHPLIPQKTLAIYKLSPDSELIHLMATDKVLKKYILKAENFHIIVEQSNFSKVRQRLESLGYLL